MDNNAQNSKIRIGDLLVSAGYITESQLKEALSIQKEQGKRVGEVLQDLGYATEKQILTALADRLGTELIDIRTYKIDVEAVNLIPKQMAEQYIMLPVANQDGQVTLAVNDPLNLYAIEDIRQTIDSSYIISGKHGSSVDIGCNINFFVTVI